MPQRPETDLERFVDAQDAVFDAVRRELSAGRKTSHWMWFVFPQLRGLGRSGTARYYGIGSPDEAAAYLAHPVLGTRLRECVRIIMQSNNTAHQIFGSPDDVKLRSSLTLFSQVAPDEILFKLALQRFFGGEADPLTVASLGIRSGASGR